MEEFSRFRRFLRGLYVSLRRPFHALITCHLSQDHQPYSLQEDVNENRRTLRLEPMASCPYSYYSVRDSGLSRFYDVEQVLKAIVAAVCAPGHTARSSTLARMSSFCHLQASHLARFDLCCPNANFHGAVSRALSLTSTLLCHPRHRIAVTARFFRLHESCERYDILNGSKVRIPDSLYGVRGVGIGGWICTLSWFFISF
jgi:hypothetical protein